MLDVYNNPNEIIQWIRSWFDENGKDSPAVIGISGGKDSTVVAALCKEALGKDRVYGVMLPCGNQPDIDDAEEVIKYLGIKKFKVNISDIYGNYLRLITGLPIMYTDQADINIKPRIRMTTLYAISQSIGGRVSNNTNLSEFFVGYGTKFGDLAGDFAPLANLTKSEVVEIGHQLCLPSFLVNKAPSDGLTGKTDEESLGVSYEDIDTYIRKGTKGLAASVVEKIESLHRRAMVTGKVLPVAQYKPNL